MKTKPEIEIDLEEVERLASLGLTQEQIAASLGIGQTTLYKRKRESADFEGAIKRGQAKGIGAVANKLYEKAMSGDVASLIFFLKARGGWKETVRNENVDDNQSDGMKSVYAKMKAAQNDDGEPV
jgi:hypothetical protein